MSKKYDLIIIGAGAAGVGCAITMRHFQIENLTILERDAVGASFMRWPQEMRFISPSFPSNGFGLMDLNAIAINTAPALSLQTEHPSGAEYARYLQRMAELFSLPIQMGVSVKQIEPLPNEEGFHILTDADDFVCRFLVWAGGEFQFPNLSPFPGAEYCLHNATIRRWKTMAGDSFLIIGGYESGIDAAVNLVQLGKRVRVLDRKAAWDSDSVDPSMSLSPYTLTRLREAMSTFRLNLVQAHVVGVEKDGSGYAVVDAAGQRWTTKAPPILATGFTGKATPIAPWFDWQGQGHPLLTEDDESTIKPNLFLCGPTVQHEGISFCFIYKFRQRFAIVAKTIADRLGLDTTAMVEIYRRQQMFLDDFSCCDDDCAC